MVIEYFHTNVIDCFCNGSVRFKALSGETLAAISANDGESNGMDFIEVMFGFCESAVGLQPVREISISVISYVQWFSKIYLGSFFTLFSDMVCVELVVCFC